MLDTEGNVKTWNAGAALLKGYSQKEIVGKHFSTFYTHDDIIAEKPRKEIDICLREGKVEDESWRLRKDGTRFWPMSSSHRCTGMASISGLAKSRVILLNEKLLSQE
jgi:PAS domain S-box-containing protein